MPALQGMRGSGSSGGHGEVEEDGMEDPFVQNIFVLRHGEVVSESDGGEGEGSGAWDPPLSERGKVQAWRAGRNFRLEEWNITRVVVSPLLRCVQTAAEVLAGLCLRPCSVQQEPGGAVNVAPSSPPPTSSIKASIECGFAKMVKRSSNGADAGSLDLTGLYALLPQEFHDTSFHSNRQMLSSYRESGADAHFGYISTLQKIANKFHTENILCITHGEGVIQSASMMWPHVEIYDVSYCAYTHAQRPHFKCVRLPKLKQDNDGSVLSGEWELLTESGSTSGILFWPS